MNAPAGIVFAKMLIPETKPELIDSELKVNKETLGANVIDALAIGAGDGLKLALNIGAMLLAFIAVIALLNFMLEVVGDWTTLNVIIAESTGGIFNKLSMEYIFGQVFRVAAFVIGVEWADTLQVGSLLGQKTVINEFVAYVSLADMQLNETISPKSITIATFALCGFSNFSSIAIQIGGIGAMAPNQQANLSRLGLKALLAATLACMMTATIAGALLSQGS
jgi:CNT family concentrative nucleoside transporter